MHTTKPAQNIKALTLTLCSLMTLIAPWSGALAADDAGCRACLQSASGLFARGDNAGAAKLLTEWQTKCPNNLQLFLMLNTVLLRMPDGKKRALEAADQACTIAPNLMLPHFQKAMTLMQLQQGAAATQEFQRVVELDPTSHESWLALSELLGAQGKAAAAKDAENHAAQLSPSARRSMLSTLASKDRAGNIQGLKQEVARLAEDPNTAPESLLIVGEEVLKMGYFESAAEALNQAKTKYPDSPQVSALLPFALFEAGKFDQSAKLCQSKSTGGATTQEALAGLNALASGDFSGGTKMIEKAAGGGANLGITFLAQGYLAMLAGHYKEAIEKFSDAQSKNAALTVAKIYVAQCNLDMGDWKEAISQAREAQQKASGLKVRAEAIELVGRLRDGEDNGGSIAALKSELVAFGPQLSPADQVLAKTALGELFLKDKEANRARELFNGALTLIPSSVPARIGLGRAALVEGDAKSALADLDRALELAPGNIDALALKAIALVESGSTEEAEAALSKATQEGELPAMTSFGLGQAFQKAGENKKAVLYFKQALLAGLNATNQGLAREALKSLGESTASK